LVKYCKCGKEHRDDGTLATNNLFSPTEVENLSAMNVDDVGKTEPLMPTSHYLSFRNSTSFRSAHIDTKKKKKTERVKKEFF
jgi:hypothetical protein